MQNSKKTIFPQENDTLPLKPSLIRVFARLDFREKNNILHRKNGIICIFLAFTMVLFDSCAPAKNTVYFENLKKDTTLQNIVAPNFDLKIRNTDMLGILVASLSPDVAFYNAPQNTVGPLNGYLVDQNGDINFVKLGVLHVEGMTRKELKDTLQILLVPYLKDVVVSVGFLNRHITMIGAVTPTVIPMLTDNMTIIDALASSGDIGDKGRIDNILVIRDNNGAKDFKRLSLKDPSIFHSPYYYMHPDDIVYVEPVIVKTKITAFQVIQYITTGISLLILILNTVKL
jgi:polysaccharide export outer membrane protein